MTVLDADAVVDKFTAPLYAQAGGVDIEAGKVDEADQPHVLAQHIQEATQRALGGLKDSAQRLQLVDGILRHLDEATSQVREPAERLLRLAPPPQPGIVTYGAVRPSTPLPRPPCSPTPGASRAWGLSSEPRWTPSIRSICCARS